jgi:putative addiction module component (TIGR02574 family)
MSLTIEQLAEEALALPANARAQLVDRLVESLDPAEDIPFCQLWAAEALRRRDEVRAGRVQTIPGNEALKLAREAASG